jgi:hypothetical protein
VKILSLFIIIFLPALVTAQYLDSEPVPWQFGELGRGYQVSIDGADDPESEWQVVRFGISGLKKISETSRLYFGMRHISFSDGGNSATDRWPGIAGPDSTFPGESRVRGWIRPYFGLISDNKLPLIGDYQFCINAGTPFSSARLYPFSSRSISAGFYLRKKWPIIDGLEMATSTGRNMIFDAVGEEFHEDAYPSTKSASVDLAVPAIGLNLSWHGLFVDKSRMSSIAELGFSIPVGESGNLNLAVERELADESVRLFGTRIKLAISFAVPDEQLEEDLEIEDLEIEEFESVGEPEQQPEQVLEQEPKLKDKFNEK